MSDEVREVDVIVLGMGPGGEEVAEKLAVAGLEVIGIDERLVGGECPYWGCVPSKMMIRAADLLAEGRRIPGMAGTSTVTADWAPVAQRIRDEATDDWDDTVAVDRFEGKGGQFVRGHGRLTGAHEITVGDQVFRARKGIVINTGTHPAIPPISGLAGTPYWTNHEAIETTTVPESLAILGGGAIGVELAQVFARFGATVTVIEGSPRLIPLEEPESGDLLATVFAAQGIDVRLGGHAQQVSYDGQQFTVSLPAGEVTATHLLVATGRAVDLHAIGVGVLGIDETLRALPVDDRMRVADGVWALGDVVGKGAFTHVSMYHSAIVLREILGEDGPPADYAALPRVTFTDPEIGSVGLTVAQARDQGLTIRVGHASIGSSTRGWIHRGEGHIIVIEDAKRGVLVGATSAGPVGGEVLGALTVAVHAQVPTATLRSMIYAYPTFHRAIEAAVADLK
ncbi:NAD(P)/FAD-dependent oxidoreductase [Acidothermaceae bacterium B102]|nr:NAD(P)/FAD-dependent oxidoreductase [Acidothermaceae bacterium B102]